VTLLRLIPVVVKQVTRHRLRSALTIGGVAIAMFLYSGVQAMQSGVEAVTQASAKDNTLIVYRKDRYCPFTSRMPESYIQRISEIPGVASVVPMRISVSNCRTSLDVVTFRGVPPESFLEEYGRRISVVAGSIEDWKRRSDAALLGRTLADRRGLSVGDRFDAAGVTVYVAGVVESDEPEHRNVGYTHLDFLQYATGSKSGGYVTQFNVRVDDPSKLDAVAAAIDAEFAADQEPTHTRSEQAFVAQAAGDVMEIVGFTRWLGWGCLAAILGLVGNAIVLAVQDRIRDHAVLQTLGYTTSQVAGMILAEGLLLSVLGGLIGSVLATGLLHWGRWSISVEGISVPIASSTLVAVSGLAMSILLGVLAGLIPAWQASRREIVECFRMV
jgi:putative ABC transport system permease protein